MSITVQQLERLQAMSAFVDHRLKMHAYQDAENEWTVNGQDFRAAKGVAMEKFGEVRTKFTVAFNRILSRATEDDQPTKETP